MKRVLRALTLAAPILALARTTAVADGFELEKAIDQLIHLALRQTDNNVSAAARLLGVSRDYLRYRLSAK